ncbi:MAG: NIPSNAP family containing protein, partial [Terracidiphilus sp.]
MERRQFLAASLATSALAATNSVAAQTTTPAREFYLLRRYHLMSGPQLKLTETFLAGALIPALQRLGFGPIGVFRLDIGPETP